MEGPIVEKAPLKGHVQLHGIGNSYMSEPIKEKDTEESSLEKQVEYLRNLVVVNGEKHKNEIQKLQNDLANEKKFSNYLSDRMDRLKSKIKHALQDEE